MFFCGPRLQRCRASGAWDLNGSLSLVRRLARRKACQGVEATGSHRMPQDAAGWSNLRASRPFLRIDGQYDAEADDEIADEGAGAFDGAAGGAAVELGGFPGSATVYFDADRVGRGALRVNDGAAGVGAIPILAPFPDISGHVVKSPGCRNAGQFQIELRELCPRERDTRLEILFPSNL